MFRFTSWLVSCTVFTYKHLSHVLLMVVGFVVVANFWDVNWVGRGSSGYTTNEVE